MRKNKSANKWVYLKRSWQLYAMILIPVVFFIIFKYFPIINARIAFYDYNMFKGISGSTWNNFGHFRELFQQTQFTQALRNTIVLNIMDLAFSFPVPIILALALNELKSNKIRNVSQTMMYIPHFLSWVIIAGIVTQLFNSTGMINNIINLMGFDRVNFLGNHSSWRAVYVGAGIWQGAGYGTIIYLAALSGIDPTLYEAAYMDGAGKFKRIWYITLPCIKGTIVTLLILSTGKLMNISFDRPNMMGNSLVLEVADVISTYVHRTGLENGRIDYATAVGLFQSVVSFIILAIVNRFAKFVGEEGIM